MDRRQFAAASLAGVGMLSADATEAAPHKLKTSKGFPKDFQWGAATAAHQIEGNNVNSDFWLMEHLKGSPFAESIWMVQVVVLSTILKSTPRSWSI